MHQDGSAAVDVLWKAMVQKGLCKPEEEVSV
eukprot:SAG25_NODE_3419_length_1087_cov_9.649798_1_plen_30_part_10